MLVKGTKFRTGVWYLAKKHTPPEVLWRADNDIHEKYDIILGIKAIGIRPGFYDNDEGNYYWHCERYDSFDDEPIPGWTREQEINNNLEPTYQKARGVICWMVVPAVNDKLPSIDGLDGFDNDPDEEWEPQDSGELDEDEKVDVDMTYLEFIEPARPIRFTKTLNLIVGVSFDDFMQLMASANDKGNDHILAVDRNGTVYLDPLPDGVKPAEWWRERKDEFQFRFETLPRDRGYMGIHALENKRWMENLYYRLLENWAEKTEGYIRA